MDQTRQGKQKRKNTNITHAHVLRGSEHPLHCTYTLYKMINQKTQHTIPVKQNAIQACYPARVLCRSSWLKPLILIKYLQK